ncbi:uncharacterized protein VTP21DRAFT_11546 [Calcarisporiella thermophila]|uniref:uncharacterized protein n=1 Tax=Calcarisporiella thermophila TaxID=911321 RepID=UPI0037446060
MTPRDLTIQIESLIVKLKRRQIVGSFNVAIETAMLMRKVVSQSRWNRVNQIIAIVKDVGIRLMEAQPRELAVGNIVRRVLHLIREETHTILEDETPASPATAVPASSAPLRTLTTSSSMLNLLEAGDQEEEDFNPNTYNLKPMIIQAIQEMIDELETVYSNIAKEAMDHIHSNEVIMTLSMSRTVREFLLFAAKKRKFSVIVAETCPSYLGHELARTLAKAGIQTTIIPDSAIFAFMARVNKVILGTHAVLANGGLIAVSGSQMLAAAAKHHSTPVVVVTGLYKLSPLYPYNVDSFNLCVAPDRVLSFTEEKIMEKVDALNPYYDYVPPEHVDLFVTNMGGHPPSYLYRLLREQYDVLDTDLSRD